MDSPQLKDIFLHVSDTVDQLLRLLSPKERFVIERRYNLDHDKGLTLEEIGKHFKVTRERIRQIQKSALQKLRRNVFTTQLPSLYSMALDVLQLHGGIMRRDLFFQELLHRIAPESAMDNDALTLAFELDAQFFLVGNTISFHPYIRIGSVRDEMLPQVCDQAVRLLEERGDTVPKQAFIDQSVALLKQISGISGALVASILHLDKRIKTLSEGYGLLNWRHIHPRTLRDKIFYVLRIHGKPLHFVEIANRIIELRFDNKRVNLQAVHNELIRCGDFILIGRGIYALKEWGFSSGTVKDVILDLLREHGDMDQDQIVVKVLERRQVKRITILLALKDDSQFVRTGRKHYALKKA